MAAVEGPSLAMFPGPQVHPASPEGRERALPPLPYTAERTNTPTNPLSAVPSVSTIAAGKRRAVSIPSMTSSEGIRQMLENPVILSHLLTATQWLPFHTLISTRKEFRQNFARSELRDVILSRFVPGYMLCLGNRAIEELSVDITIEDLALFRESQTSSVNHFA